MNKGTSRISNGDPEEFFNDLPEIYKFNTNDVTRTMRDEMNRRYTNENIILRNIKSRKMQSSQQNDGGYFVSPLTGEKMLIEEFTHNNMKPFFGGSLKQNMKFDLYDSKLENFTGVSKSRCDKDSVRCFSDIKSTNKDFDPAYVTQRERMVVPTIKNNVLPTEPVRVGPGFDPNNKFAYEPTGGLQQTDIAYESGMFKSVDDLRSKSNPKVTYDGQLLYGQKGSERAEVKEIAKNRVERFYEQDHEDLLKTTGAVSKEKMRPCFEEKPTKRQTDVQEYKGAAYARGSGNDAQNVPKNSGPVKKSFLSSFGLRNLVNSKVSNKDDDYGKKNIKIYTNGKDLTTVKARQGNISSLIKSMITPIQDALQPTTKEFTVNTARSFPGNINGPNKLTTYDPTGVARTTIKETTIHDTTTGNMRVDPTVVVYDPKDVARTTLKQTLENYSNDINLKANNKPAITHVGPIDHTTRELTENAMRDGNVASTVQHGDGYRNSTFNAQSTHRETTSDNDYYGMPESENSDGYKSSKVEAKTTQKQFTSDNEYTGNKGDNTQPESYEAIYNSVINDTNEQLLEGRNPTQSSVKLTTGVLGIKNTKDRFDCGLRSARDTANYQPRVEGPRIDMIKMRDFKKSSDIETGLDISVIDQLSDNPFAISISGQK